MINGDNNNITDSNFVNNTAFEGAGLLVNGNNTNINNSTFDGNDAFEGAGVLINGDNNTIDNSSFVNNTAVDGAGALINGNNNNISDSNFTNNTADNGAGLLINGNNTNINNSTFDHNNATDGAGALINGDNTNITNSTFSNNNATNGGGVLANGTNTNIDNSRFINNTAENGAGAIVGDNSTVKNSNFTGNNATTGAGVILDGNNSNIINSTFTNNTADTGAGAVIYGDNATVNQSQFINNTANEGAGVISYGNNTHISDSNFENNTAEKGAGTVIEGDGADITNTTYKNNNASEGAGVIVDGNNAVIQNSSFINNTAVNGSSVILNGNNNTVTNSTFINNTAEVGAGVIVKGNNSQVTNSTFIGNNATESGSVVSVGMDSNNNTITGNNASNNYVREKVVPSDEVVSYSSRTTISVSKSYVLGDSIKVNVKVETNGNYAFDGLVTLTLGDYEDTLSLINSQAVFTLNTVDLGEGSFVVYAKYSNDTHCSPSQTSESFIVRPQSTIKAGNIKRGYNSSYDYRATFYDFNGNVLANTYVEFEVKGVKYKVKTNSKGIAYIKDKLKPGTYKVTIKNPVTQESTTKTFKIVKRIQASNKRYYYSSGAFYKVRIYKDDGNPVGAGCKVKFTFRGQNYTVKTDKKGYAKIRVATVNATPKTYKIRITYKSYTTVKKITIRHVIHANKVSQISKSDARVKIKILLKSSKILKNKNIKVTFLKQLYKYKTNKKGEAYFQMNKYGENHIKYGRTYRLIITYNKEVLYRYIKIKNKYSSNFNVYFIL